MLTSRLGELHLSDESLSAGSQLKYVGVKEVRERESRKKLKTGAGIPHLTSSFPAIRLSKIEVAVQRGMSQHFKCRGKLLDGDELDTVTSVARR
jgi:hypothetical protein